MPPQPVIAVVIDEQDPRVTGSRPAAAVRRRLHDPRARIGECRPALTRWRPSRWSSPPSSWPARATGVELLGGVRRTHPDARRVLLVGRGQWASHPVRRAMVLGEVDGYLFVPWLPREQWLYLPMAEYLADWSRTQVPELTGDHDRRSTVGRPVPRPARHPESRPACRTPSTSRTPRRGRRRWPRWGWTARCCRSVRFHTGQVAADPATSTSSEMLGFLSSRPGLACDVRSSVPDPRASPRPCTPRPRGSRR